MKYNHIDEQMTELERLGFPPIEEQEPIESEWPDDYPELEPAYQIQALIRQNI